MKKTKAVMVKKASQSDRVKEAKNPKDIMKTRARKLTTSSKSKAKYA